MMPDLSFLHASPFYEFAALLTLAALAGFIGLLLRQPMIVSFIAVGVLAGPSVLGIVQSHENIDLLAELGEPAYEVAAFIRNPIPELLNHADAPNIIHNRVIRFSELFELPPQRILDWCFVQAVLSWAWSLEDGCDTDCFERTTRIWDELL